jgi:TonB family protein
MILTVLINGLWQGALIVAIAYLISHAISERNSTTRSALWFATLVAIVIVPMLTTVSNAGALLLDAVRPHSSGATYAVSLLPTGTLAERADTWFAQFAPWILSAWLVGVAVNLLRLGVSFMRIDRIRRNARQLAGTDPDVFLSEDIDVPIVAGILTPAILMPKPLLYKLTSVDLQRIVQHERAHIYRNDALLNVIARVIEAWLFFNPWVRLAGARVSAEREAACDDWVVEKTGNPDEYAACLAALAETAHPGKAPILTPSAFRSRHALVSRIERLSSSEPRRLTINPYAIGGIVMMFTLVTLVLQAFAPALALTSSAQVGIQAVPGAALAATCAQPNTGALVVTAAEPNLPHGLKVRGYVNVLVTIAPSGHVVRATIVHSSGNATIDSAVADAARHSTYAPKTVNCALVQGNYLFHAQFEPSA